jgi:ACS family tartrate transporter-like MFS transporter
MNKLTLEAQAASIDRGFLGKLSLRLIAPLTLLIVLNSLDRVNVSFAALRMNKDLGLSPEHYGFGISIFFLGYVLLQFPHALSQRLIGARAWIFTTILVWGAIATAMAFVSTAPAFYLLRFLLGAAEGGFAPGVVYFLSQWAPRRYRGWAVAGTMLAIPISVVIGGPLSGWLMTMVQNPAGLAGWRWMFLIEGLTPMVLAFVSLAVFNNRLEEARWLTAAEKTALRRELDLEAAQAEAAGAARLVDVFRNGRVWGCVVVWFCLMSGAYGLLFWMPQVVKQMSSLGDFAASALGALPWAGFGIGMMLNAWLSDRAQERFWHFGLPAVLGALFLAAVATVPPGLPALVCIILAGLFMGAAQGAFWPIPVSYLGPGAAAAGITLINLMGNSAGLISPILIGWIRHETGSFRLPIYALAALMLLAAMIMIPLARASKKH